MSYVQFTTGNKHGGLQLILGALQGQSTSTEKQPYKGPLNWFPDRCCRMEGLELAASPSFRQTTCGWGEL